MLAGKCEGRRDERYEGHTGCGHSENLGRPTFEGSGVGIGEVNVAFDLPR